MNQEERRPPSKPHVRRDASNDAVYPRWGRAGIDNFSPQVILQWTRAFRALIDDSLVPPVGCSIVNVSQHERGKKIDT